MGVPNVLLVERGEELRRVLYVGVRDEVDTSVGGVGLGGFGTSAIKGDEVVHCML